MKTVQTLLGAQRGESCEVRIQMRLIMQGREEWCYDKEWILQKQTTESL
jgi:hypothetical protein